MRGLGMAPAVCAFVLLLGLLLLGWAPGEVAAQEGGAFLQAALPLRPLVTTPVELLQPSKAGVSVSGRQAITVVYSRPVIALGADFGAADNYGDRVPFNLSCSGLPGRFRWVTTTIARWDPDVDWPADLDCALVFNTALTTYDGVPVVPPPVTTRALITQPLSMNLQSVQSERATNLTDGLWSANTGLEDDKQPEVPDDGILSLYFSYPVNLTQLAGALRLEPAVEGLLINVTRCITPAPWTDGQDVASSEGAVESCAQVSFSKPLAVDTAYSLVLREGTRYNALSGATKAPLSVKLAGLRRFRLPLKTTWQALTSPSQFVYDGVQYRRLDFWLPHGVADGVSADALAAQLSVCAVDQPFARNSACMPLNLTNPELRTRGVLRVEVPSLQPGRQHKLAVRGDAGLRDGYGLPLEPTTAEFWTTKSTPLFTGPDGATVFVMEQPPASWPLLVRGNDPNLREAGVWHVDLLQPGAVLDVLRVLHNASGNVYVPDVLGAPGNQVGRGNSEEATLVNLGLDPASKAAILAYCCNQSPNTWGQLRPASANIRLLLTSNITASFVTSNGNQVGVWVTRTDPTAPGPEANATAHIYGFHYSMSQQGPKLLASCTTGGDGWCTLPMPPAAANSGMQLIGFVVAATGDGVYAPNAGWWAMESRVSTVGKLVLDRGLARPGDTLHLTGYVQSRGADGRLAAPGAAVGQAMVLVSPSWDATQAGDPPRVTVSVDPDHGSLHATLVVPANASVGQYSLQLLIPDPATANGTTKGDGGADTPMTKGRRHAHHHHKRHLHHLRALAEELPGGDPALAVSEDAAEQGVGAQGGATRRNLLSGVGAGGTGRTAASLSVSSSAVAPDAYMGKGVAGTGDGGTSGTAYFSTVGWIAVDTEPLVIADPRPPTADLTLTAPTWAKPTDLVNISVQATSYIGTQVAGSNITVLWRTPKASGLLNLTTDADGKASGGVALGDLPPTNISASGDVLSLEATWIGPTRERIVRSDTVKLQSAAIRVGLSRNLATSLPGVAFGVVVDVLSSESESSDEVPLKGVPVNVTLYPNATAGVSCTTTSACEGVTSGADAAACQLSLPCVGVFTLRACTADGAACADLSLGRNESEWAAAPLTAFDDPTISLNATKYHEGDVAGLSFQNPWGGADVAVVWGDSEHPLQRTLTRGVPAGPVTLPLPIGPECRSGCSVLVLGAVARSAPGANPSVPTSKLFDPSAPHTFSMTTTLNVVEDRGLNVTLNISPDTPRTNTTNNDSSTAIVTAPSMGVVAPGATATISFNVTQPGTGEPLEGAEVTVIAVDKAVLDLVPYGLQPLESALVLHLYSQLSSTGVDDTRVAGGAIEAVFSALLRRLGLDPWVQVDTRVLPSPITVYYGGVYMDSGYVRNPPSTANVSPVDQNDTAFLSQFATFATIVPYTYGCFSRSCYGRNDGGAMGLAEGGILVANSLPQAMASVATDAAFNKGATQDTSGPPSTGGGSTASAGAPTRLASQFESTPLFVAAKTRADGSGAVTFTAPQNLGTFVLRAYVVSSGGRYLGTTEGKLIVRRALSLTPSLPRAVRTGDAFAAGVLVTLTGPISPGEVVRVAVQVEVTPVTGGGPQPLDLSSTTTSLTVELSAAAVQTEVRFNFTALALGTARLRFAAATLPAPTTHTTTNDTAAGDSTAATAATADGAVTEGDVAAVTGDAVEVTVSVLAQQSALYVATSFALRGPAPGDPANATGWQEGLVLPAVVPGSGSLDLVAGVGHLPAVVALYEGILKSQDNDWARANPSGTEALALSTLPAVLAAYGQSPNTQQSAAAAKAVSDLASLTHPQYGLMWGLPGRWGNPTRADTVLNAWAAWVVGTYTLPRDSPFADRWSTVREKLAPAWVVAAQKQVVADAQMSRHPQWGTGYPYSDNYTLAWVRLASGGEWAPKPCASADSGWAWDTSGTCCQDPLVCTDLSLAANLKAEDTTARLLLALALQAVNKPRYRAFITAVSDAAVGSLRVQGRTAYIAAGAGQRGAAGGDTQALALLLLNQLGDPDRAPVVQKLAAFVAQVPAASPDLSSASLPSLPPPSTWASVLGSRALVSYDDTAGSTTPDLHLEAAVDNTTLLAAHFEANATGAPVLARSSTSWEDLPTPPGPLTFHVSGSGEASLAVSLGFVPAALLPYPTYRGLWVEAAVQLVDVLSGTPVGPALAAVPLASVVQVTVQITTPDDLRGGVSVELLMPGGLEPLDTNVYTDSGAGGSSGCALSDAVGPYWARAFPFWWWPVCPAQAVQPSKVTWHYDRLMAGTHTLSVRAVAATQGVFSLPPVKASADLQPEVMGMTAGGVFEVCGAGCAPRPLPPPAARVPCPLDCSNHGGCDISSGRCSCAPGFTGEACDVGVIE